jgi:hypothetical protein
MQVRRDQQCSVNVNGLFWGVTVWPPSAKPSVAAQFETLVKTRCIALCSSPPIFTVQRLLRKCQSKSSSRRTWRNSVGSTFAFPAINCRYLTRLWRRATLTEAPISRFSRRSIPRGWLDRPHRSWRFRVPQAPCKRSIGTQLNSATNNPARSIVPPTPIVGPIAHRDSGLTPISPRHSRDVQGPYLPISG